MRYCNNEWQQRHIWYSPETGVKERIDDWIRSIQRPPKPWYHVVEQGEEDNQ